MAGMHGGGGRDRDDNAGRNGSNGAGRNVPCGLPGENGMEPAAVISDAVERAAAALCARWKPTLLLLLATGARRRSELDRCLPDGVSPKVLTDQLRGLEADGIVARVDYRALRHTGPRHVTYALTPAGEELAGVVRSLAEWGATHVATDPGAPARGAPRAAPVAHRVVVAADRRTPDLYRPLQARTAPPSQA